MKVSGRILIMFICLAFAQSVMAYNGADSVTETKKITSFNTLKIHGNFNVVLTQGKTCSLKVVAPDKDAMSSVEVKSGVILAINMKEGAKAAATLYITCNDFQQIAITTEGSVSCTNTLSPDNLSLTIDGNATCSFMLDVKMLTYNSSSSKPIVLKGKAKACTFKDSGEGSVDASELKTENMNLEDSSDGDLKVYAHPELHVKIAGSGTLTYYGKPRTKTFRVEGQATDKQVIENK